MSKNIFRKVSLERLSSPEQLDQLMRVTSPMGWVALLGIAVLFFFALVWSVTGSLPTTVQGQGVLLKSGGVFDVVSINAGRVENVSVRVGERVEAGQTVAWVERPDLSDELVRARAELEELRAELSQEQSLASRDASVRRDYIDDKRAQQERGIELAEERQTWLEEKVRAQAELYDEGLITEQTLINTRQELYATQQEVARYRNDLRQIALEALALEGGRAQASLSTEVRIAQAQRRIDQLEEDLLENTRIVSTYSGRVLEVTASRGDLLPTGATVLKLDLVGREVKDLEAVVYVSALDGKRIRPGMEIRLVPATVKQEEHGFIVGRVTYVSDYPASRQGMLHTLNNDELVQRLGGGSAPYEVRADLLLDPDTPSGFKWTSSQGPESRIQSGTLCMASAVTERRRPIELAMPFLKRRFSG